MIRLQEVFEDLDATKPVRIETGAQHIADDREFINWVMQDRRANFMSYDMMHFALNVVPHFMKDFIMETGSAIRIPELGILKIRYHKNELKLSLRNEKDLIKGLNETTCQIDKYVIKGRTKIKCGGRRSTPRNLLPK